MKERKKQLKRLLAVALSLVVIGGSVNLPVLTSLAEDDTDSSGPTVTGTNDPSGQGTEQDTPDEPGTEPGTPGTPGAPDGQGTEPGGGENQDDAGPAERSQEFTVEVKNLDEDLPDSDELFAGYVEQLFYEGFNDGIATLGNVGADKLTDPKLKTAYTELKKVIEEVAAGNRTSTKDIAVPYAMTWTTAELGSDFDAAADIAGDKILEAVDPVISYLLMDCPYELYWFDKTIGYQFSYDFVQRGETYSISRLSFQFVVASEYRAADMFTVDAAKVGGVKKAADNAKAIVTKHEGKSDYEKLAAYCQEICDLVSYYDEAAEDAYMPYGNPWQMVWVFDGDSTTNVVCEGYAKAFQYLCDMSTFKDAVCYTICGEMGGGTGAGGHMWNIVTLEGKNYLVDVTNSDEGTIGSGGELFLAGTKANTDGSYTFNIWGEDINFIYDDDQWSLFGKDVLTLSETNYIQKEKLTITAPAISVTYGDKVSNELLAAVTAADKNGNPVAGKVGWAIEGDSYGAAGKNTLKALFVPTDLETYAVQAFTVEVNVKRKPITITTQSAEKEYGQDDPEFKVIVDSSTPLVAGETLAGALGREAGENVKEGGYAINVGTLPESNPNYEITFALGSVLTIKPTDKYMVSAVAEQNVVAEIGKFTEPVFTGMNDEVISGSVAYTYNNVTGMKYDEVVAELAKLVVGDTGEIGYTFVPGSGNYIGRQGTIKFTVRDIEFVVGDAQATLDNAVTVKQNPTYGDTWADIVKVAKITAKVGDESDNEASHFTLDVSGMPLAGEGQAFRVLYNGTVGGKEFKDQVVCSGVVTVAKKALTWDVSGLEAVDSEQSLNGGSNATLYGELRVAGILPADAADVRFAPESKLVGTYGATTPGEQKVTLAWEDPNYVAVLTGTKIDNYTMPAALPVLTGRINAVSVQPSVPESTADVEYRLEFENGISVVPETLAQIGLNTPSKIEGKMENEIQKKLPNGSKSYEVYDVVLKVKDENGNWVKVDKDNFPKGGITVTMSYPEGTGKDTHDFEVVHMFTEEMNGYKPGDIEYPAAVKGDAIQFKVTSLSPIALGWKEVKKTEGGTTGENTESGSFPKKSTAPKTGDANTMMLYVLFMMLGVAGIGYSVKRRTMR